MQFRPWLVIVSFTIARLGAQEKIRHFQPLFSPPVIVTGHPYSTQSTLDTSVTILNGNHRSSRIYARQIFRDGAGRTRIEEPFLMSAPLGTLPVVIEIQDVVGKARYILDVQRHVAHRSVYGQAKPFSLAGTQPPAELPKYQSLNEDLGTQTFDGLVAQGTRTTLTYPPGTWGWDRAVSTVNETWMMKDLRVILMSKNVQPDSQEMIMKLTNLSRAEPDAALFMVPAGYTVVDETGAFSIDYSGQ